MLKTFSYGWTTTRIVLMVFCQPQSNPDELLLLWFFTCISLRGLTALLSALVCTKLPLSGFPWWHMKAWRARPQGSYFSWPSSTNAGPDCISSSLYQFHSCFLMFFSYALPLVLSSDSYSFLRYSPVQIKDLNVLLSLTSLQMTAL